MPNIIIILDCAYVFNTKFLILSIFLCRFTTKNCMKNLQPTIQVDFYNRSYKDFEI